jgi:hypothetical protein
MIMAQLKNRTKTAQTLNIPCKESCAKAQKKDDDGKEGADAGKDCICSLQHYSRTVTDADGVTGVLEEDRRLPGSITVLAGKEPTEVPDWVAESDVVKAAIANGQLEVVEAKDAKAKVSPPRAGEKPGQE